MMSGFFEFFPPSGSHAGEVVSSHTHEFESTHGGRTQGALSTPTWLGQWPYHYHIHRLVLPHDPLILSPQYPEGPGTRLVPGIGPHINEINCGQE